MDKLSHRRTKRAVQLRTREGQPLVKKKIQWEQEKHEFLFGCGAFDFLSLLHWEEGKKPQFFQERVDLWLSLFNYATMPFYWGGFELSEGYPETRNRMKVAKYLREQGVTIKGHPLCWHTACADWLLKYDNAHILKKQLERINRETSNFQGVIDMWDVINEVVIMPDFDKYDNAITRICKEQGRVELVKQVFEEAKKTNPEAVLLINDFNTSPEYEALIGECLDRGVPISAIGIQSHQHQGYWGAEKLHEVLERYEKFGLPIHFTENTIISGREIPPEIQDLNDFKAMDWPSTPEGEQRQKEQTEEMYRILFEHPLVEAITWWDFADGAWLNAPSGLVRRDNSVKPVYECLSQMINKEWHTLGEAITDENGIIELDGFKGDYCLRGDGCAARITLTEEISSVNPQVIEMEAFS